MKEIQLDLDISPGAMPSLDGVSVEQFFRIVVETSTGDFECHSFGMVLMVTSGARSILNDQAFFCCCGDCPSVLSPQVVRPTPTWVA